MRKVLSAISGTAMAMVAGTAVAADTSPVFGHADVQATTSTENKGIVGKGQYGELYAYYGSYYASYAQEYGTLGQYYGYSSSTGGTSYYLDAYYYASYASTYYYYAYYYESKGM